MSERWLLGNVVHLVFMSLSSLRLKVCRFVCPRRRFKCFPRFVPQVSEEDQVLLCCLQSSVTVLEKSHAVVQACFSEQCRSAVTSICQVCEEYRLSVSVFTSFPVPTGGVSYGRVRRSDQSWLFCVCREGKRET